MRVFLTLLLCLFAAAPSLDAWACKSDEGAPLSIAGLSTSTTSGDSKRETGNQHRCFCAGHCCPSGVAVEPLAVERASPIADTDAQHVHAAEDVVPQAPQKFERPPRA